MPFAPDVTLTTVKGESITLSSLVGRVVLLDFWATWCGPCRESLPELKELSKRYPADKLVIISISADDEEDAWRSFITSKNMDWYQYRDADGHVQTAFNIHSYPSYFLIDREGIVRESINGLDPHQTLMSRLREPLKKMLGK